MTAGRVEDLARQATADLIEAMLAGADALRDRAADRSGVWDAGDLEDFREQAATLEATATALEDVSQ